VAEFESGNVDVLYVPEGETRNWEQTDEKKAMLESAPALRVFYIAINTTRGPLADKRVRQALNYAVDAKGILDGIVSGRGNLAAGVIPPALPGGDSARKGYARNVAKAKQLLAEAGFAGGIDVELWSSQTPPFPRIAQTVQAYLKEANVRVTLVQRDASSMREAARAGKTDMALKDWFADYPDAENFLYPLLHTANKGVGGNVSFYSNPQFDKLVNDARREQDESKRTALYAVQPWITNFKVPTIFTGQRWTDVGIQFQR
jgi:ABC-type transport system substrate-binding protein